MFDYRYLPIMAKTAAMAVTRPVAIIIGYHRDSWFIFDVSALSFPDSAISFAISASIFLKFACLVSISIISFMSVSFVV